MNEDKHYVDAERLDLPSASGFEIVAACPGSVNLRKSLPLESTAKKEEEDEWAASGTRIHGAFETGNTLELDKDEAEIYRQGVAYEEQIVEKWMEEKKLGDCEEGPREMRVYVHNPLKFPEILGSVKIDRHYIGLPRSRGLVLVTDLKSGFNPNLPPSPHSWQLRFAATAIWKEEYGDWMKEARVGYCKAQQKCTVNDYCDYQESDLNYAWQSIQFHLWQSTQHDAPLHPGPHCRWCPCKAHCVQAGAYSLMPSVIAKAVSENPIMTPDMVVEHMQPSDLLKIYENSTIIGKIIDAVKSRLKSMPAEALAALGLELGKGRKLDPIANVSEAARFLVGHFSGEDIAKCMSLSKGKLSELVILEKSLSKEAAGKWIDTNLDPWIARCFSEPPLRKIK